MSAVNWLPTDGHSVFEAAVLYTENNWPVIRVYGVTPQGVCLCPAGSQCKTPGKHPIGVKWADKAARTPDEARDMFRSHTGNIGIPIPPHLCALDTDKEATIEAWAAEGKILPETLTAFSGSGRGRHLLYSLTPAQRKCLANKRIADGIDLRVGGGQIVVAPSQHYKGGQYSWGPLVPIVPIPDWLFAIASAAKDTLVQRPMRVIAGGKSKGYVSATLDGVCADIASAGDGERNHTLFSKATHAFEVLLSHDLDPEAHAGPIADAARAAGLDDLEIEKTIASALATARKSPASSVTNMRIPVMPPPTSSPGDEWRKLLAYSEKGGLCKTYGNVALILRHDTDLAWNEVTETPEWKGIALTDARLGELREQVFAKKHGMNVALDMMWNGIVHIASERSYHPVRRYLEALVWDGKPWIGRILHHILGHIDPTEVNQAMLRAWLISAVARAMRPGCKADAILVLCGPQGYFKSSFFDALASPWFSDTFMTPDRDGMLRLRRTWITELAEIDQLTTGFDAGKIKAFITTRSDVLRRSYGRINEALDRHSVFAGTTNELRFLSQDTGTRRFWTIEVTTPVDRALVADWRDQIWAEAMAAYRGGEPWWLAVDVESIRSEAAEHFVAGDPWEAPLHEWLAQRPNDPVTTVQVTSTCLGVDLSNLDMKLSKRIGKIMRKLGRVYKTIRQGEKTFKAWVPSRD